MTTAYNSAYGRLKLQISPLPATFCQLLSNPSIDVELEYIFGKLMKRRIQRYRLLSIRKYYQTFMLELNTFLLQNTPLKPLANGEKLPHNPPLPLEARGPHLIHECIGWPHLPPQMASGSNQPFRHNTLCRPRYRQMVQANIPYHERSTCNADKERRTRKW